MCDAVSDGGSIPPASTILHRNELREYDGLVYNKTYNAFAEMRYCLPMFVMRVHRPEIRNRWHWASVIGSAPTMG